MCILSRKRPAEMPRLEQNKKKTEDKNMMNWKVIETCYASKFEEPFERVIAQFDTFVLADDFIDLVIPKETKERFRIEHI